MRTWVMVGLAAAMMASVAGAAPRVDPRLQAVLGCAGIADPAARLACFDGAVTPLREAATSGALEGRSLGPKSLEDKIRALRGQGPDRLLVQLENKDRWLLMLEGDERLPRPGQVATLKRGALGNWWFTVAKGRTFQAKFLGQPEAGATR